MLRRAAYVRHHLGATGCATHLARLPGRARAHAVARPRRPLNERRQLTVFGTTIDFCHHQVLRDIDKTAGQVTGVGSFQCRIGQPLRAPWVEMKY